MDKFLQRLSIPRGKTRRRGVSEDKYVPRAKAEYPALPEMQTGDVFAYKKDSGYRVFAVVRRQKAYSRAVVFCCAMTN